MVDGIAAGGGFASPGSSHANGNRGNDEEEREGGPNAALFPAAPLRRRRIIVRLGASGVGRSAGLELEVPRLLGGRSGGVLGMGAAGDARGRIFLIVVGRGVPP